MVYSLKINYFLYNRDLADAGNCKNHSLYKRQSYWLDKSFNGFAVNQKWTSLHVTWNYNVEQQSHWIKTNLFMKIWGKMIFKKT